MTSRFASAPRSPARGSRNYFDSTATSGSSYSSDNYGSQQSHSQHVHNHSNSSPFNQYNTQINSRNRASMQSRYNSYNSTANRGQSGASHLFTRQRPLLPPLSNDSILNANIFSTRFAQTRNLVEWLDEQSSVFDKLKTNNELSLIDKEFQNVFSTLHTALDDLNDLLKNQTHSFKQNKTKLNSLRHRCADTQDTLEKKIKKSKRFIKIRQQREELFRGANKKGAKLTQADEISSIQSSIQMVTNALEGVRNITDELWHQKALLSQTRNKLLNMTNLVGFSNSLIRVITQRSTVDQWILIGGMCLTLFIIFLIWWFLM